MLLTKNRVWAALSAEYRRWGARRRNWARDIKAEVSPEKRARLAGAKDAAALARLRIQAIAAMLDLPPIEDAYTVAGDPLEPDARLRYVEET